MLRIKSIQYLVLGFVASAILTVSIGLFAIFGIKKIENSLFANRDCLINVETLMLISRDMYKIRGATRSFIISNQSDEDRNLQLKIITDAYKEIDQSWKDYESTPFSQNELEIWNSFKSSFFVWKEMITKYLELEKKYYDQKNVNTKIADTLNKKMQKYVNVILVSTFNTTAKLLEDDLILNRKIASVTIDKYDLDATFVSQFIIGTTIVTGLIEILLILIMRRFWLIRKTAEEKLTKSEKKYRTLIEQSSDGVFITDKNFNIFDVNSGGCKMLGYSLEELLSMNILDISKPNDEIIVQNDFQRLSDGESLITERELKSKNGNYIPVEVNSKMLPDGNIFSFARDISERKKAETERFRLQNLESLGMIAGGIAHDFNNLLASIMGNASLIEMDAEDEDTKKSISRIIDSSKKSTVLTHKLLTFAKGGSPIKTRISLRNLIEEIINYSLDVSNINVEFSFMEKLIIEADPDQLSQALQNIIINAKEALPNGGKISISTEDVYEGEKEYVKISITDSGRGISKENISKIFNPYFTTKDTYDIKGTGLGLSVSYSIINKHGGKIVVNSEVGKGTTFEILLPGSKKEIKIFDSEVKEIIPNTEPSKLKILIMDDEEYIRDVLKDMLNKYEHFVDETKEGNEAIKLYKKSLEQNNPYDIIILDLIIKGGMGGKETIKKIREINPNVKAIVSSGFSDSAISSYKEDGFIAKLNKPYSMKELQDVISEVINN